MLDQLSHSLWLAPLIACMVIVAIHSYLGLHVIARGDLRGSLSLRWPHSVLLSRSSGADPDSDSKLRYALGFTRSAPRCSL
jgi:hypothetical protein